MKQQWLAILVLVLVLAGGFWLTTRLNRIEFYINGDEPGLNLVEWTGQMTDEYNAAGKAICDIVAKTRNEITYDEATLDYCADDNQEPDHNVNPPPPFN